MSGGVALGPALPAMALGDAPAPVAGLSALPGGVPDVKAPEMDSVPSLPPLHGDEHGSGSSFTSVQHLAAKIHSPECGACEIPELPPLPKLPVVPPCGCETPPPPEERHHHPKLWISKSADHEVAKPGDVVTYTVTFKNTGDGAFEDKPVITDHLGGVLENAKLVPGSLSSTIPSVWFNGDAKTITWSGWLSEGQSGSFTYQVKVKPLEDEDSTEALNNVVTAPHSNCEAVDPDPECKVHIPIVHGHHEEKGPEKGPELAHTGADQAATAGWAGLACLTGGGLLTVSARRARR